MARDLFINTDSGSIETAVVAGLNRPRQPVPMWTIVEGETQDINLYLVKSDGVGQSFNHEARRKAVKRLVYAD